MPEFPFLQRFPGHGRKKGGVDFSLSGFRVFRELDDVFFPVLGHPLILFFVYWRSIRPGGSAEMFGEVSMPRKHYHWSEGVPSAKGTPFRTETGLHF